MQEFNVEEYIPVAERIRLFYAKYPEGRLITSVVEHHAKRGFIFMKCEAYRKFDDTGPASVGHAFEYRDDGEVNSTSYIENGETSCVGRALALLGFAVERGIASREEMLSIQRHRESGARGGEDHRYNRPAALLPQAPAYEWDERNGKMILALKDGQPEPNEVACPIHPGKTMKRRTNNDGESWLSHKTDGDRYCSAKFSRPPRPQAQAADLRARLVEHNQNGRTSN